ncbi:5-oxoprolinase/urea amidolyase family protein [Microbacterium esteraromaticum]|uniref:5-oxoprolinase/urea amidolyase family protein n=1 Tax=Microbacterium esteraromaticum TaxID=57043 RepID=A0A7D7W7D6_9MICO|nr:urea amidolyase family protein [Microbacterium esteraromaticum]QMU96996.1 5-oxoprolinase/urea amidolyase family protein [Microbacterium esteraromaticum]
MRVLTASDRALLVECADLDEAMRMHRAWADVPGVLERVPGARTVLVRFDPLRTSADELALELTAVVAGGSAQASGVEVTVPVRYEGEDLGDVGEMLGVSTAELIRRHSAARWTVAFTGFAPGFGYLVGDDPLFDVPRRTSPRTRVPAGSVALAGRFSGVYPRESPGGWQLIGTADAVMWDVHRDPPALLAPGTVVRFVDAERAAVSGVSDASVAERRVESRRAGGGPDGLVVPTGAGARAAVSGVSDASAAERRVESRRAGGGPDGLVVPAGADERAVEVIDPGLQLLVQDLGRPGHAELGVPASGAADRVALRDANRAVGNAPSAAVLEGVGAIALGFRGAGVAAVAGADAELAVIRADGRAVSIPHGAPFAVADGDRLEIGPPMRGLRVSIAVRGGIRMPDQLGSRSTDTLSGIGPAPLRAGDLIAIGDAPTTAVESASPPRELPAPGDLTVLDITRGPRDDWFVRDSVGLLTEQEWLVTPRSDRVGIRLHGERALQRAIPDELPSEGAVAGAIQVPSDGQPVLFGPDHPTTGGYPIIGALTDRARDLAGQLPPGARIRFRLASGISDDSAGTRRVDPRHAWSRPFGQ